MVEYIQLHVAPHCLTVDDQQAAHGVLQTFLVFQTACRWLNAQLFVTDFRPVPLQSFLKQAGPACLQPPTVLRHCSRASLLLVSGWHDAGMPSVFLSLSGP